MLDENDVLAVWRSKDDDTLQRTSLMIALRENPKQDTNADIENKSDENMTALVVSRIAIAAVTKLPAIASRIDKNSIDSELMDVMLITLTTFEMP